MAEHPLAGRSSTAVHEAYGIGGTIDILGSPS
jgi:hypothetical protein